MGTVATKGEMLVALRYTVNAPKVVFQPVTTNALLSCPPHPPVNVGKQHREAGLGASNYVSKFYRGAGGHTPLVLHLTFSNTKKCDFFHRFFRNRSVHHKDSQSVVFAQPFLGSNKRYREEPPKILFQLLSCQRSYAVPGWGVAT